MLVKFQQNELQNTFRDGWRKVKLKLWFLFLVLSSSFFFCQMKPKFFWLCWEQQSPTKKASWRLVCSGNRWVWIITFNYIVGGCLKNVEFGITSITWRIGTFKPSKISNYLISKKYSLKEKLWGAKLANFWFIWTPQIFTKNWKFEKFK